MTNKIKMSFHSIRAEEQLKSNTILFLQKELQNLSKTKRRTLFQRYAVSFASVFIIFLSGIISYNAYFTPMAYVDLDVNPSIELMVNRFDRVIDAHAFNDDGENIITELSIKHKSYSDALVILMEAISQQGYLQDGGLVSVTLQTDNESKEKALLTNIQTDIEVYLSGHHYTAQVDVFTVSGDTRSHSYELGISPAKYLAIQELIEVDPTASVESCQGHSISEIKQLTQEHGTHHDNGHHANGHHNNGHHGKDKGKR